MVIRAAFVAHCGTRKIRLSAKTVAELLDVTEAIMSVDRTASTRKLIACCECDQVCMLESLCSCCRRGEKRGGSDSRNPHRPMTTSKGEEMTYLFFSVAVRAKAA